ncbi:hypothetical protein O0I10_010364 [Lichtheimia ornata]|uniref:Heterokaryon incompatibility domain-containing protein n=1 Tax=Lichtheimia ornata TaxID=688661 RepID=A0AAD7UVP9_9FUNG|nr:uncharacterized protein O0I10_010364 [Lichtheimia ornata]KAJ8654028.1 hypothetical protein O0I10_010364 [Lichtheimia ornata]
MTCDIEDDNDPYKININLEDDSDSNKKAYFEKGLRTLLADPFFLLLYVPEDGDRMQIIRPANDSYHRKRMIKKINEAKRVPSFYYALSHLWGLTKDNLYEWNQISDYVDDEEGQPVKPVSMRPEKRDALLALLKDHPDSYWWIDVLCARFDTPLDIMGDIYAYCLECIAMIDCEPNLISEIHTAVDELAALEKLAYREEIEWSTYKELCQPKCSLLVEHLHTFFQSEWWQRVWTWQEMALPVGDVRYIAETDIHRFQTNSLTLDIMTASKISSMTYYHVDFDKQNDAFYEVRLCLSDIKAAKTSNSYRISGIDFRGRFERAVWSLSGSKRRCYDPVDYVYGVLGMLRIKIPRMEDPNDVWRHFLSQLDDLVPRDGRWIDLADEIDLRKVKNIGEVYHEWYKVLNKR